MEDEEPRFRKVEAENHGGLDDWFKKEKWVDVSRPKKKGKFQPCGRGDTSKGHKPVCTPVNKAKNLSDRERKNRIRQKRRKEKEPNSDKKPNVTKYTEQAGGKSNVSSTNIRFVGSIIPLSELRPKEPKFVKIAIAGEENEPIDTNLSPDFMKDSDDASMLTDIIIAKAQRVYKLLYPGNNNLSDETDIDILQHIVGHLHNQAGIEDEDDIMLVMEYLEEELQDGVAAFQYPNLKPIVEKATL